MKNGEKNLNINNNATNHINELADFWFYTIGVNVIYGDSKNKRPLVRWKKYQSRTVSVEEFEQWKKENQFQHGLFIIPGKVWRGEHQDKYLVVIDCDQEKGMKKLLWFFGTDINLRDLYKETIVVQHKDQLDKGHLYFYSSIPFKRKTSDDILSIEIKTNHDVVCVPPSIHKNGERYLIMGSFIPKLLTEEESLDLLNHIHNICKKNQVKYFDNSHGRFDHKITNMIKTLQIDTNVKIAEGTRHKNLLYIANSLLWTHKNNPKISEKRLREFFFEINNKLCTKPSPDEEVKRVWKYTLNHINKYNEFNSQSTSTNNIDKNSLIRDGSEEILSKYNFATIEETKEILYYQNGVYLKGGETIIEKEAEKLFGYAIRNSHINEIRGHIMRRTFVKSCEFDNVLNIVNLKDGLYNIKEDKLESHAPTYYSRNQKPIHFIPKAKPQLFGKFLSEVLHPHEIRTAIEMMAYTFLRDNPYEIYCILIGKGANGKGVFTGIISILHGLQNIGNVSLESILNERFALADLENKNVNSYVNT